MASKNKNIACGKCKKIIVNKDFLRCCSCTKSYHLNCTKTSQKLFDLMERKEAWKCHTCHTIGNKGKSSSNVTPSTSSNSLCHKASSTPSQDNVTLRKPAQNKHLVLKETSDTELSTDMSYESIQSENDDIDATYNPNRSCPDVRNIAEETIREYKNIITNLESRLQSAEDEIENLILENGILKKQIDEKDLTIKKLNCICTSPTKVLNNKKQRKTLNLSEILLSDQINKQDDLRNQQNLSSISTSALEIRGGAPTLLKDTILRSNNQAYTAVSTSRVNREKVKLCVLSNHKNVGTLQALESSISDNVLYCHHSVPDGGIKELLNGLNNKLQNFTMNDYCIIFVGEQDLINSDNSINLVNYIRESLLNITHTNKIICVPTYVCGALIYNYKVEMFNNLLTMDMQSNNYAYIFDTNRDLTLDMFSYHSGKITKYGIKNVFVSLMIFLEYIHTNCANETLNNNVSQSLCHTGIAKSNMFFRC